MPLTCNILIAQENVERNTNAVAVFKHELNGFLSENINNPRILLRIRRICDAFIVNNPEIILQNVMNDGEVIYPYELEVHEEDPEDEQQLPLPPAFWQRIEYQVVPIPEDPPIELDLGPRDGWWDIPVPPPVENHIVWDRRVGWNRSPYNEEEYLKEKTKQFKKDWGLEPNPIFA